MASKPKSDREPTRNKTLPYEKLPWPGLKAHDRLSRIVTQIVKDLREARETEEWTLAQVAGILDMVPPTTVMRIVVAEMLRRRRRVLFDARLLKSLSRLARHDVKPSAEPNP